MKIYPIQEIIPEKNIVVFSPHFDDVLFMLGGYILELKKAGLLDTKHFHVNLLFSRSNYQAGSGSANFDTSLQRIKLATGNRIIEDQDCLNEMLGAFNYIYQIIGEGECLTRGKAMADSEMEFPHGMYEDFSPDDELIFERMKQRVGKWAVQENTALIFPMAIKEHIDHFITREAGLVVAKELGNTAKAKFYFQEDKPYGGIATVEELGRIEDFIHDNQLESRLYAYDPQSIIDLAFKHYISQVEEVYKAGILGRAEFLKEKMQDSNYLDRICVWK
ncbi:hypothetical protein AQPE_4429 [Aquipluma nitroreducens]|uniref:PIG-L family deacetylase n=1 Tax=Aquipluma nitroreducens TaxID=2010828 RepID=A0A5K7SF77_9BACT|nr:hypothetical protein [Aquipluma nitroreducens]BBE20238.1 hypothetical protein AQPE_4429 [Aquipluma nitroreducens]